MDVIRVTYKVGECEMSTSYCAERFSVDEIIEEILEETPEAEVLSVIRERLEYPS